MTAAYRIIAVDEYWRVMRDSKLHSTHASLSAAQAQVTKEKALDDAREHAARPARTITELFRALQDNARAAPEYNARDWREFSERFNEVYARAYAGRKGD